MHVFLFMYSTCFLQRGVPVPSNSQQFQGTVSPTKQVL